MTPAGPSTTLHADSSSPSEFRNTRPPRSDFDVGRIELDTEPIPTETAALSATVPVPRKGSSTNPGMADAEHRFVVLVRVEPPRESWRL